MGNFLGKKAVLVVFLTTAIIFYTMYVNSGISPASCACNPPLPPPACGVIGADPCGQCLSPDEGSCQLIETTCSSCACVYDWIGTPCALSCPSDQCGNNVNPYRDYPGAQAGSCDGRGNCNVFCDYESETCVPAIECKLSDYCFGELQCNYGGSRKFPQGWSWGNIYSLSALTEDRSLGQCSDGHDNECDGTCDEDVDGDGIGCVINGFSYPPDTDCDITPPVQYNWTPINNSVLITTTPIIRLNTSEPAMCRWSLSDLGYDSMTGDCTGDGTTGHSCSTSGFSQGPQWLYIACADLLGNNHSAATNTGLRYTVDTLPPVQSGWRPAKNSTVYSSSFIIDFNLNENGNCKWNLNDLSYSLMAIIPGSDCTGDGTLNQSCPASGLTEPNTTVYIACGDSYGNRNTAANNEHINYSVILSVPSSTILSPPAGSWHNLVIDVNILDSNVNVCKYRVVSNSIETRPWTVRTCNTVVTLFIDLVDPDPLFVCKHEGANTCMIEVLGNRTSDGNVSTDKRNFSIDQTNPVFVNYTPTNIFGVCDYQSGKSCWFKPSIDTFHEIWSRDTLSGPFRQYISFTKNGCVPGSCPAGNEVRSSLIISPPYYEGDILTNNSLMDIRLGGCTNCNSTDMITQSYAITGNVDVNLTAWISMRDTAGNGNALGFLDTGWDILIDTRPPTASIIINFDDFYTSVTSVNLDLTYADNLGTLNSGVANCRYSNDGIFDTELWEVCSPARDWTLHSDDGIKTVFYQVRDNVGHIKTANDTITLDTTPPFVSMNINRNANYTNRTSITLYINAHDYGGSGIIDGILSPACKFWNETESVPLTWENCGFRPKPGSWQKAWTLYPPDGVKTVNVMVRDAVQNTNQTNDTIILDTTPPFCVINPMPQYVPANFSFTWNASDENGLLETRIEFNSSDNSTIRVATQFPLFCDPVLSPDQNTTQNCRGQDGFIYYFRCVTKDNALNAYVSPFVNTTVDNFAPNAAIDKLPYWLGPKSSKWIGNRSINISWRGNDTVSGLKCFNVEWSAGAGWNYINYDNTGTLKTNCSVQTLSGWVLFDSNTTPIIDGQQYIFRVNATDNVGNVSTYDYTNTTVDSLPPVLVINLNQAGGAVNITSNATDNISGILFNNISWDADSGSGTRSCGSSGGPISGPGTSYCSQAVIFGKFIKVNVTAMDWANNSVTEIRFIGPLANFVFRTLHIILGGSYILKVQVRNGETQRDNITIDLGGEYPSGLAKFLDFGINYTLQKQNRQLVVYLAPLTEETYFVEVASSEVDEVGKSLTLTASSQLTGRVDTDSLIVTVGYPVSFSEINEWAIIILVTLSVLIYHFVFADKKKIAGGGISAQKDFDSFVCSSFYRPTSLVKILHIFLCNIIFFDRR